MTKKSLLALMLAASVAACKGEAAEDIAPEDDTVSGAEMPAGQTLALDSLHNVRVIERGLQFDEGYYYARDSAGDRWVPSSHQYSAKDTVFFNPVIKGFGSADGKVSMSLRFIVRDAGGRAIHESHGSKSVLRFPEDEARFTTLAMPMKWLDSLADSHTASHYDVEYTLKDRITGKSIDGLYRIHVARE